MNKKNIEEKYLAQHNALGSRKDAVDKDLFDQNHRQVWADCGTELKAKKAELEAKATLSEVGKQELTELGQMFPNPSPPRRNLVAEMARAIREAQSFDELKAKVEKLEK